VGGGGGRLLRIFLTIYSGSEDGGVVVVPDRKYNVAT